MDTKICGNCKLSKTLSDYRTMTEKRRKVPLTYHCSICKDCERFRALQKYHANKEKYQLQNRIYKSENIDKINSTRRKYMQEKMQDAKERLKRNMKSLISCKVKKVFSTKEYLGTSFELIHEWFEFNFDDHMTWENYGEYWQIDHTIPISSFDLEDTSQTIICFSWMNLMPLEKTKNLQKSSKLCLHRVWHQEIKLRKFAKMKVINVHEFLQKYATTLKAII